MTEMLKRIYEKLTDATAALEIERQVDAQLFFEYSLAAARARLAGNEDEAKAFQADADRVKRGG